MDRSMCWSFVEIISVTAWCSIMSIILLRVSSACLSLFACFSSFPSCHRVEYQKHFTLRHYWLVSVSWPVLGLHWTQRHMFCRAAAGTALLWVVQSGVQCVTPFPPCRDGEDCPSVFFVLCCFGGFGWLVFVWLVFAFCSPTGRAKAEQTRAPLPKERSFTDKWWHRSVLLLFTAHAALVLRR